MHLTLVSYPSSVDTDIEDAVPRMDGWSAPLCRAVARCDEPGEVLDRVKHIVHGFDRPILLQRLDLYGHGHPGSLTLGDPGDPRCINLKTDSAFWRDLKELGKCLAPNAHVRLLGCDTGACLAGFRLIKELAMRLGQERVVWAPRTDIAWSDFGFDGFKEELARQYLVSSQTLTEPVPSVSRPGPVPIDAKYRPWLERLQPGYVPRGYADMPAATLDGTGRLKGLTISVRCARRVIAFTSEDSPRRPYLFRWLDCASAPSLMDLAQRLGLQLEAV